MTDVRTEYHTCPLCEATCGLELRVEGDRVIRIRGDRDDVFSKGFLCPKGTALGELHADPDRLRAPLVRTGRNTDGSPIFTEVSWPEAFTRVAEGLAPILAGDDRDPVGVYLGNPNVHNLAGTIYIRPLLTAMGTRNIFSASTVDQMPKHVSAGLMFGNPGTIPVPDLDRTDYLLMLGANPYASNGSLCTAPDFPGRLDALRERGGRLVVVDPRRSRTAEVADEHIPIQPGTDALFLCALIHELFATDRITLGATEGLVAGLDELRDAVAPFSPVAVADACRVSAETIARIATELTGAGAAAVYGRIGTHTVRFGTVASWAVDVLNTITGNLDRAGGAMFPLAANASAPRTAPGGRGFISGRWHSRVKNFPEVRSEFPVATLPDEILTPGSGQIRALVTVAGNPVTSCPDGARMDEALGSLDFMVSVDIYCNETTRHADVILPPPSPLERSHFDLAFNGLAVRNVANWSAPVFPAGGPSEADILAKLALMFSGAGADADPDIVHELVLAGVLASGTKNESSPAAGRDPEDLRPLVTGDVAEDRVVDALVRCGAYGDGFGADPDGISLAALKDAPHGIDLGPLEARLPGAISTPSGAIELAPDPVISDLESLAATVADRPADLVMVGRRQLRDNNSWMHNLKILRKGKDRFSLHVHPDDADRFGLVDGRTAAVTSAVGTIEVPVEITDSVMTGVVSLPHGWGHDRPGVALDVATERPGVNSNLLTDPTVIDPLSGNCALNAIPVTVSPGS